MDLELFGQIVMSILLIIGVVFLFSVISPDASLADWKDVPNVCEREYNATMVSVVTERKCVGMPWTVRCVRLENNHTFVVDDWTDSIDYKR